MAGAPKIRVELDSGTPVLRQIVDQLRVLLVEGGLKPGTALPSVRRLAIDLGIHFNTVAEAYRQLADEGWLELKQGRGAIVIERAAPAATRKVGDFRRRLRELISQMRAAGVPLEKIAEELRSQAGGMPGRAK
jgi:GntR family transcriptional regulator